MPTPSVIDQYRFSDAINRRSWDQNYFLDQFNVQPNTSKVGGGAATGTAGDNNILYTQHGAYEWNVIGTQTILAPKLDSVSGLNFGMNLVQDAAVAGDGIELCLGQSPQCPATFVIGSSAAFYMRAQFMVQDASGTNPLILGFRKVQAFDATLTNYTDFAMIGIEGTANPNTIFIDTQIGSAAHTQVNTTQTWADSTSLTTGVHYLGVFVDAQGVTTFQIDGQPPVVTSAYTFTTGLQVMPFIRFTQAADITTFVNCNWLEIGFQQ